ncbi:PEP1 [Pieris rapae granulovirus Wuhan]|uniref:PEP1 n=1 Tax=Pieris rapae granulovirus Wuhan TaxID=2848030 RepID=D2J4I7_9BBAC|nr:PEP1 [Betabaculovirus arrapae]ACZ63506.1 PEP1 [Betabaculovirus arrapae]ADO85445.1 pep [Pieris rapae granulovirus]AGS18783.1 PEP1 [Pieris rapae granulovirus]UOS85694.1 PEP1 [Pieris rapae granulovirus]
MTSIPADSKAFIKPFEGTDVICLVIDVVAWFGADEIASILNQNLRKVFKSLPASQKALWKQLEPQINSEKQFISSLAVRLLIGNNKNNDFEGQNNSCFTPSSCTKPRSSCFKPSSSCFKQTDCFNEPKCSLNSSNSVTTYKKERPNCNQSTFCPKFKICESLHNLGNIFINEAIYDVRAYPQIDEINCKINQIYNILLQQEITN